MSPAGVTVVVAPEKLERLLAVGFKPVEEPAPKRAPRRQETKK
ncbi:hypothetical protein [Prescottella agglutinans]|nr:hypothetical protein [Prescottella agglutinans]